MEFLEENYIQTSTSISVNSNTLLAENILIKDPTFQHVSSGLNADNLFSTITISFDQTLPVSRISILETNAKEFNIYYNGLTANAFSFTTTSATTTSQWLNNSETSLYLRANTVNCTSLTLDIKSTQTANNEKAVGYIYAGDTKIVFPRIPTSKNYSPVKKTKEVVHKLSDGGIRIHHVEKKFSTKIKFKYITEDFRNSLESVWSEKGAFWFCAFGTSSSWDGIFYNVVWRGDFDFYKYTEDSKTANFSGSITLDEV